MFYIFLAAVVLVAVLLFAKKTKARTTQDVIGDTEITQDGLIRSGNTYRLVIEVEPKNLETASATEQKSLWVNFLSMANTINIPYTLLVQSRLFEMKDYADDLTKRISNSDMPAELKESGEQVLEHLRLSTEEAQIRDISGYVILQYDPVAASQTTNVQTGVRQLDSLIGKSKSKMTDAEKADLARQILTDAAEIVFSFCEQAGMRYQLLSRAGVLNATYQLLQRDMAPQARMIDAIHADAFRPIKRSLTADEVMEHG
ncbi:hypothetical protein [Cohnella thermotolerans]|uniref:hypothetical protein n=1 Tax=Cohnella thermotolerans TaxID=329858 RepID=UPI000414E733|nr:hypothetical protein [Cohnella thermotolerans]